MTQLYQATAKKPNILVGCINRSAVSEPHEEIFSLCSVRPQLDVCVHFWTLEDFWTLSPCLVLLEGVHKKATGMTSGPENVTYKERWGVV